MISHLQSPAQDLEQSDPEVWPVAVLWLERVARASAYARGADTERTRGNPNGLPVSTLEDQ